MICQARGRDSRSDERVAHRRRRQQIGSGGNKLGEEAADRRRPWQQARSSGFQILALRTGHGLKFTFAFYQG